jgi:hypothetical protein
MLLVRTLLPMKVGAVTAPGIGVQAVLRAEAFLRCPRLNQRKRLVLAVYTWIRSGLTMLYV